jgi:hypothetical protein
VNDVIYYGSAVLVALLLGGISAWWAVGCGMRGCIRCGAWRHYPGYGSVTANPYVRAQTQIAGPLALDRSEAIYFIADCDDDGEVLRPGRNYRIEGGDLDARWWSLTAYGDDHHLIRNPMKRYSYSSANVAKNADGSWTIRLSSTEESGNWIPTGDRRWFELFLRVYNPAPAVLEQVGSVAVPRIIREDTTDE